MSIEMLPFALRDPCWLATPRINPNRPKGNSKTAGT